VFDVVVWWVIGWVTLSPVLILRKLKVVLSDTPTYFFSIGFRGAVMRLMATRLHPPAIFLPPPHTHPYCFQFEIHPDKTTHIKPRTSNMITDY